MQSGRARSAAPVLSGSTRWQLSEQIEAVLHLSEVDAARKSAAEARQAAAERKAAAAKKSATPAVKPATPAAVPAAEETAGHQSATTAAHPKPTLAVMHAVTTQVKLAAQQAGPAAGGKASEAAALTTRIEPGAPSSQLAGGKAGATKEVRGSALIATPGVARGGEWSTVWSPASGPGESVEQGGARLQQLSTPVSAQRGGRGA